MERSTHHYPHVVIVGAGFGGLWAVRALARTSVEVTLVDRHNYHTFLPLLYQVAAAEIEPEAIAYPVRAILRRYGNVRFRMAEVHEVDRDARLVRTSQGNIPYDFLILALGSISHFFGIPGAAEYAFRLKTMDEAIVLRNHILGCFERASCEPDPARRRQLLTFVIVGGGPTGVEFAGALAELIGGSLHRDYPHLDFREVHIILLEAMEALLPNLPQRLQAYALARLRSMGVEVRLQAPVSRIEPHVVRIRDGTSLPTETVIWTAGVQGEPQAKAWGLPIARAGRIAVQPTLQVPGHPEIYVVGDLAYLEEDGIPLPMVAPVAVQQGQWAAQNILRQLRGEEPQPFRYRDRGTMVTIGRNAAVAHVSRRSFTGFSAWLLWLGVHLFNLIGFRNRLLVLMNWAWDYLFYERTIRLILPASLNPLQRRASSDAAAPPADPIPPVGCTR
ncbi:MAG: NAD(P)/FAD-dependent oxidoreductase [Anaerolineae bacterium]|nr:NAD(P)/FAD-dependent oxidoreductase [Anaerolineae bacterium]MDW8099551.1 NAD(P)/FAD-dependent oxidoreductase [Anaerolineae bacterium]